MCRYAVDAFIKIGSKHKFLRKQRDEEIIGKYY